MSLDKNIKLRGVKDIFTPIKWKVYFRYLRTTVSSLFIKPIKAWRKGYPELSTEYQLEQIVFRMTQNVCRPCITKGECLHCGCNSPELFFDKYNHCSAYGWYAMISEEKWTIYKLRHNVVIDKDYLEQVRSKGVIYKWKN